MIKSGISQSSSLIYVAHRLTWEANNSEVLLLEAIKETLDFKDTVNPKGFNISFVSV